MIWQLFLTIAVGIAGGIIGRWLKLPTGAMLGAMIAVAIFGVATELSYFPSVYRTPIQIFSGALIGCRINRSDIKGLKAIVVPLIVLMSGMILMNVAVGIAIKTLSPLDIVTALFASAPGGVSDMSLIAEEFGANTAQVAILQLVRILTVFSVFLPLFKRFGENGWKLSIKKPPKTESHEKTEKKEKAKAARKPVNWLNFILTMIASAAGGILFYFLGVPAGAMVGAMLFSSIFNIATGRGEFPIVIRPWMQMIVGAFLGVKVTRESLISLAALPVPVLLLALGVICSTFTIALLMHKFTKLPLQTCFLSSTPGGLQEMSLMADDMGADTPKVAIMQTVRLFTVILLFPTLLRLLSLWLA